MSLLLFIVSLSVLLFVSHRAAHRMLPHDQRLATLTLFASLLAFSVTSLGYLELLFAHPFLSAEAASLSTLCTASLLWFISRGPSGLRQAFRQAQCTAQPPREEYILGDVGRLFLYVCVALFLVIFGLAIFVALSSPPRGYDALWFHLPLADHFYRTESFLPETSFKWFWHPANMNLVFASLLSITRGGALNLTGIFFLALTTYATAKIYIRLCPPTEKNKTRGAVIIALWIATTPCYFFLSLLVLTDLPSIALTALALYWFVSWYQTRDIAHLLLTGLSIGLALGTKTAALPVFAGICVLLTFEIVWQKTPRRQAALWFIIFLGGAFLAGGFWYVRNAVMMNNPFHPLSIAVGPFQLGAADLGLIDPSKERWWLGGDEWWRWFFFPFSEAWYSHEWGMGLLPGLFVLVGFFLLPFSFFSRRTSPLTRALLFLIVLHLIGWWAASRHFRHLLLLWPVVLPLLLRLFLRIRGSWIIAFVWSFYAIYTIVDITILTNRWEQSVEEEPDWHAYYGLPHDYETRLPAGTIIANWIGEPNHFPLLGIDGRYKVIGYNDASNKSAAQLIEMGASYAVSLHRVKAKMPQKEGFVLVEEWYLPKRFRWWGFFKRDFAVMRLWRLTPR
jgi:hypothetical protein